MRRFLTLVVGIAMLATLAGCASGPRTLDERTRSWEMAFEERLAEVVGGEPGERVRASIGFALVRVEFRFDDDTTWDEAEASIREALDALAEPPFAHFGSGLLFPSRSSEFEWRLYYPDDIEPSIAATEVWFEHRDDVVGDAALAGNSIYVIVQSDGDRVAEREALVAQFADAGIDVDNSTIRVAAPE